MTVLVTGGAGYIGSHMVLALKDAGESVVVLDNLSTGFREAVPADVPLVIGDVGDNALLLRTLGKHQIDAVAHFAARIVAPDSVRDPLGYYAANTLRTHGLLETLVAANVNRFIFSSTAAVYGMAPPTPTPESAPCDPASPYGASKAMSERILRDVGAAHGMSYVVLRYFNVAGADPAMRAGQRSPAASNLITLAVRAALGIGPKLQIMGVDLPTPDGTGVRDYIHVSDLADAHMAALRHLRNDRGSLTLNCGYGHGYSVREVVDAVGRVTGKPLPVIEGPRREGDPYVSIADATRIRAKLGWRPIRDDIDLMVDHALRWERMLRGSRASAIEKRRA